MFGVNTVVLVPVEKAIQGNALMTVTQNIQRLLHFKETQINMR
jgi:hypothetical protein